MSDNLQQFQSELRALRGAAEAFSRAHPGVASELRLSAGHSADPHVEQLLQSFAWLTGSLRQDLHTQRHEIPNHLLLSLYPNQVKSTPCMAVMQANVLADGANFVTGSQLEKGRLFISRSVAHRSPEGDEKLPVECRMQCCYDTPLWPFAIDDVALKPKNIFEFLDKRSDVQSVISVSMNSYGTDPIYEYPVKRLRYYIADLDINGRLYSVLSENFCGLAVRIGDELIELPDAAINWLGFDESDSVLPAHPGSHSAYRLLQEYFYFSEKFYFFEITGLDLRASTDKFELLILLDQADTQLKLSQESLGFNCFPAINLFPATFKPIQLDHCNYEYRLLADETQYGQSEVHSVSNVRLISSDGAIETAEPWLGGNGANDGASAVSDKISELSYLTRLVEPLSFTAKGCDTMISLQDKSLRPASVVDQTMSVKGTCSNRNLPESLRVGNVLKLIGTGAMPDAVVITRPTLFKPAQLSGESTVKLLSQLHLNQRSLVEDINGGKALSRLQDLLASYSDPMMPSQKKQIDGIVEMQASPLVRRMGKDAWRGHYRGTKLVLTLDESFFSGANPLLLGEVLSHFFGLYTTLNHFVELHLLSYQREGTWKKWRPRIGEQVIL